MAQPRRWLVQEVPGDEIELLAREADLPHLTARLLVLRGIKDAAAADRFLHPRLNHLRPPSDLPGVPATTERLRLALQRGEKVLVSGDYDVDGITSTALLTKVLRSAGLAVEARLPSRQDEGYGFHISMVETARQLGVSLVITVDSGISAHETVEYARSVGIDVVITDHHEPKGTLPAAWAVVNPKREDAPYSERDLAGVGVAFKVAQALIDAGLARYALAELLELAALGTVADVAPLIGENRVLVYQGLEALAVTRNPGLIALKEVVRLAPGEPVTAKTVGFQLGPRINAAGRLGRPDLALQLLMTGDQEEARAAARELDRENRRRQQIEEAILHQAVAAVEKENLAEDPFLLVSGEGWHDGVIGIVASRLAERYYRPTAVVAVHNESGRGSARSIPGFHLLKSLEACAARLEQFGGHQVAAGFKCHRDQIAGLRDELNRYCREVACLEDSERILLADARIDFREIDEDLLDGVSAMAPFGLGNPRPTFVAGPLIIRYPPRRVGAGGSHLKLVLAAGNTAYDAVGFGLGSLAGGLAGSRAVEAAFGLERNCWQGIERIQLRLKDVRSLQA